MLAVTDDDRVRVVTLNRPDRRNALTPAGLDDLRAAVRGADQPVVYVHGRARRSVPARTSTRSGASTASAARRSPGAASAR